MEKITVFSLLTLTVLTCVIIWMTLVKIDLHTYVTYVLRTENEMELNNIDDGMLSVRIPVKSVLKKMKLPVISELYHRYVNNLQILCPVRDIFGGVGRGYGLCSPLKQPNQAACSVVLFGKEDRKENSTKPKPNMILKEIKKDYRCDVYQYEISAVLADIENKSTETNISIKEHVLKIRSIDVLLIDTSFNVSLLLRKMLKMELLKNVKQLVVNFNNTNDNTTALEYAEHLHLLRNLYVEGFRIYSFERVFKCLHRKNEWRTGCYILFLMRPMPVRQPITFPAKEKLKRLATSKAAKMYHQYLVSTQMLCRDIVRVGHIQAGGWDICNDTEYRPPADCLVYSFGIARDWSFDDEIARRYGCEVHSFDPTIYRRNHKRSEKVTFHNMGLGGKNGRAPLRFYGTNFPIFTLATIKKKLGHTKRHIDVLKMDIEFSEWDALPDMIRSGVLCNVTQLLLEEQIEDLTLLKWETGDSVN